MKSFDYDYDEENDSLFVYLPNKKSAGAVELGNFLFDFDENEKLMAIEILDASKTLSKLLSKIIELSNNAEFKVEVTDFRNMNSIRFSIKTPSETETVNIILPNIREKSPALDY
ncbi:MAG: DUF2283 domain-containing protein [Candidatus Pacearchaeota archaeon]